MPQKAQITVVAPLQHGVSGSLLQKNKVLKVLEQTVKTNCKFKTLKIELKLKHSK